MMTTTDLCIKQNNGMGDLDKGSSEGPVGVKPLLLQTVQDRMGGKE